MLEDARANVIIFYLGFVYATSIPQILNTYCVPGIMLDIRDKDECNHFPQGV